MSPTFDINRWLLLVRQHWIENKKRYQLSILAIFGLLFIWFFFLLSVDQSSPMDRDTQRGTYFFFLFSGGCFYASQFFKDLGSRSKAINYLLIPASSFEKLLCSLLYSIVLYFIVYTAIFYLVDSITVAAANAFHPSYLEPGTSGIVNKASVLNVFERLGHPNGTPYFFGTFFAVQSAFFLGSVYYERYSFVKTVISLFVVLLIFYSIGLIIIKWFMPDGSYHSGMASYRFFEGSNKPDHLVELPSWIRSTLKMSLQWGFPFFFFLITYHRLKEKEV